MRKVFVLLLMFLVYPPCFGLIHYLENDSKLTNSPAELKEIWDCHGQWGNFGGVTIGPRHFITAKHSGAYQYFILNGEQHDIMGYYDDATSDLRICKVRSSFQKWVNLNTGLEEISQHVKVFGRGVPRGQEIKRNNELVGWEWGQHDGYLRWGDSRVSNILSSAFGDMLVMPFNVRRDIIHLASLSWGDSGSGVFSYDEKQGIWKLSGINYAVQGPFSSNNLGQNPVTGAMFNTAGWFLYDGVRWFPQETPSASQSYAVRISTRIVWINDVLRLTSDIPIPTVQFSSTFTGPWEDEIDPIYNGIDALISVFAPTETRFYRLKSDRRTQIIGAQRNGILLTFRYKAL